MGLIPARPQQQQQQEARLEHVALRAHGRINLRAQPMREERERPQPLVAVVRRARVEGLKEEGDLAEVEVRTRE